MDPRDFLSNKRVLLSSGGTQLYDNYYSLANSSMSLVETTYSMGRYSQSLSSLSFGSTSNIIIPNQSFLAETYLQLELPAPTGQALCRGWGYSVIKEIQYSIGASNTPLISLSGEGVLMAVMSQCTSEEKRTEIFQLAGDSYFAVPVDLNPLEDEPRYRANVLLPLPWSTACDKLSLDTQLLSNPITITISFKDATSIYGGPTNLHPSAFLSGRLIFRQGDMTNTALSLKGRMIQDPSLMYAYPLTHFQAYPISPFPGSKESDALSGCSVNLQGFINSDLIGIAFYVVKSTDLVSTAGSVPSSFNAANITNIRLLYNGQIVYNAPAELNKSVNMIGDQMASFWDNQYMTGAGAGPFVPKDVSSYLTFIDFSRSRGACWQNHFFNTFRVSNQTLRVEFNTPEGPVTQYQMFALYVYNGVVEFKNGQSYLYFD